MGLLLYILLFIFIYYTVKVAWKFYGIYRKLHDATKQFRDFSNSQNRSAYSQSSASQSSATQSSTTPTGEVIEDRRTEDEISRKIFTQEEGEYVDYEEVK